MRRTHCRSPSASGTLSRQFCADRRVHGRPLSWRMAPAPACSTRSWKRWHRAWRERDIASLRFQFPYMQRNQKRPDPPLVAQATVRAAVSEAARRLPGLPLFAGGKSFGGRMTSQAQAAAPLTGVCGLVFIGFPLHPAGTPSVKRAEHLSQVLVPMLFLQGSRDSLADLGLMKSVIARLGDRPRSRCSRMPIIPSMCARAAAPVMSRS